MIVKYVDSKNKRTIIDIPKIFQISKSFEMIEYSSKKEFLQQFISLYKAGQKLVLFDKNHKQLLDFYKSNNINYFKNIENLEKDTQLLFFTSGSSGFPIGAFKTRKNLESEITVLKKLIEQRVNVKKVIVTVPFVHIYGILAGVLLPMSLGDVEIIVKEDFLPYEILNELKDIESLVITTPVFIKAFARLLENENLNKSMFVSSTGPLDIGDVILFEEKYNTTLLQIFGSTETGGIAYKISTKKQWMPLDGVKIDKVDEQLAIDSEFISSNTITNQIQKIDRPFITEDIIELSGEGFELLGRTNKIIKIAGKRISTLAIESLIEDIKGVKRAVVHVKHKKELLRSEQIIIVLEASKKIDIKLIKQKIITSYGIITIPFSIVYKDEIKLSSMGKKIIF